MENKINNWTNQYSADVQADMILQLLNALI